MDEWMGGWMEMILSNLGKAIILLSLLAMFKASHPLGRKERKAFVARIHKEFPTLTEADVDALLPPKQDVVKSELRDGGVVYVVERNPVFFVPCTRSDLFPTLYALWTIPYLLPPLTVFANVVPRLIAGADLMAPGVFVPPDGLGVFHVGEKHVLLATDHPTPVAVGVMEMESGALEKAGVKGKAMKVMHIVHDFLWEMGCKELSRERICTDPMSQPPPLQEDPIEHVALDAEEPEGPSGEAMDALVTQCFFQALVEVKESDLPILANVFYAKHMQPNSPPDVFVDVKKSSFKKLSKLFQEMENDDAIRTTEDKGVLSIVSINRSHDEYQRYDETEKEPRATQRRTIVEELFEPTATSVPFSRNLDILASDPSGYFTLQNIQNAVQAYVEKHNLSYGERRKKVISVNDDMARLVFLDKKCSGDQTTLREFVETLCDRMKKHLKVVTRTGDIVMRRGTRDHVIRLSAESRQGNKSVTLVTGLETFGISPEEEAQKWQRIFAASTTTHPLPGRSDGKQVQIQGNVLKPLATSLTEDFGIPKQYIHVEDRIKGKKKKK